VMVIEHYYSLDEHSGFFGQSLDGLL
jgi:hypothetical protein